MKAKYRCEYCGGKALKEHNYWRCQSCGQQLGAFQIVKLDDRAIKLLEAKEK